jgi:multiple sugar transport system substrate-binding protein
LRAPGLKKIKKALGIGLILSVLSPFLLSCRSHDHRITLHLWIMPNSLDPVVEMKRALRDFELENPGIRVEVSVFDWTVAWTKITTAATTKNGPDIVQMPTTWAAAITEMDALLALDSLLESVGGDSVFVETSMKFARPVGSDSVTSIPWFLDVRPLYYRKDVLNQLQVNPEDIRTWEDFNEVLQKILDAKIVIEGKEVAPIGYPGRGDMNMVHSFAPWIWGSGGDFLDSAMTRSRLADEESIRGILAFLDLVRRGFNNPNNLEKTMSQVSSDFDEGRLAFWFDATNKTIFLNSPRFLGGQGMGVTARNYSCMLPPVASLEHDAYYFAGGSNLSVFKFSKHPKESAALVRYLSTRSEVALYMSRISGFLPALKDTYEYSYFQEDEKRRIFQKMVKSSKSYPAVSFWGEIETNILLQHFGNMFDLIAAAPWGTWPEEGIIREIRAADREINELIRKRQSLR